MWYNAHDTHTHTHTHEVRDTMHTTPPPTTARRCTHYLLIIITSKVVETKRILLLLLAHPSRVCCGPAWRGTRDLQGDTGVDATHAHTDTACKDAVTSRWVRDRESHVRINTKAHTVTSNEMSCLHTHGLVIRQTGAVVDIMSIKMNGTLRM